MILEELKIERERWGKDKGKFKGSVRFANETRRIEMALTHELSERLLKVVGMDLVEAAKELAEDLTADCIEALPNLDLERLTG